MVIMFPLMLISQITTEQFWQVKVTLPWAPTGTLGSCHCIFPTSARSPTTMRMLVIWLHCEGSANSNLTSSKPILTLRGALPPAAPPHASQPLSPSEHNGTFPHTAALHTPGNRMCVLLASCCPRGTILCHSPLSLRYHDIQTIAVWAALSHTSFETTLFWTGT